MPFHSHQYFHYILQLIYQLFFFTFTIFITQIFSNITWFITWTVTITGIPKKSFITYSFITYTTYTSAFIFILSLFIITNTWIESTFTFASFMPLYMSYFISQWCNLTLARWFSVTKVYLRASEISKMTVWSPDWPSNFLKRKLWKLFSIFFDKMVSILINIIQHEQYFFSFQAQASAVCLFHLKFMPHYAWVSCLIIGLTRNTVE